MGRQLPPPRHGRLRPAVLLGGLGLVALLSAGCSTPAGTGQSEKSPAQPVSAGQPVEMVQAVLEDKVIPEPGKRISWSTTWRACFKPGRADTTRMEAQAVTTEGSGTSLRHLEGGCLKVEVARGQNDAKAGTPGRDVQLSDAAQLSYRVRAVHADGTVTPWTKPIIAGSTKP